MIRTILIASILLVCGAGAFAQSDAELVETVRSSAVKIYLEQVPITVPESFLNSGLSPSDKERLIVQLANSSADCLADSVIEYAALYDVPIADFVSLDGTIHFDGDSGREFEQLLNPCIHNAWQEAGVSR
jgi:hypothetical protein